MPVLPRRRPESDFSLIIDVGPVPEAVPATRHAVAKVLMSWGLAAICDDAALCLTEAVTNALTHARPSGMVTVRIYRDVSCLRIEVADADRRMIPAVHDPDMADREPGTALPSEHGWGLYIVGALSSRWGVVAGDNGKRVWFELEIPAQQ